MIDDTDEESFNFVSNKNLKNTSYDFINIDSVSYLFNENFFNATMWLKSLNELKSNKIDGIIKYGILIDSDLKSKTGLDGIDYKLEKTVHIQDNESQLQYKLLEISKEGYERTISSGSENFNAVNHNENYINLDINLKNILNPERYRVLFYTIYNQPTLSDPLLIIDTLRKIHIPPPEISLKFSENPIKILKGSNKNIELTINSKSLHDADLQLYFKDLPDGTSIQFDDEKIKNSPNNITTNGFTKISSMNNINSIIQINAHQTREPINQTAKFITTPVFYHKIEYFKNFTDNYNSDNVYSDLDEELMSKPEPQEMDVRVEIFEDNFFDKIHAIWIKLGGFLTFIYVPLAALLPIIIKNIKNIKKINAVNLTKKI
ncbi:MAG: hypothetical protein ACE5SW_09030 [Nitrososphaeraceae archaeon]